MISDILCKVGKHKLIPTKRKFIGYGKYEYNTGYDVESVPTYIYIVEYRCTRCKKHTTAVGETIVTSYIKQPYDVVFPTTYIEIKEI